MKKYLLFIICIFFLENVHAQTRYLVRFKNKGNNPFSISNPSQYLSQRAIQRRQRYNIAIDSTDLPVTPAYVQSVRQAGAVTILNTSKWLNEVAIKTTDAAALVVINNLPFVLSTTAVAARINEIPVPVNKKLDSISGLVPVSSYTGKIAADFYNYGRSHGQVHLHQGKFLHNHGFRGEGMHMGILDAGFYHYLSLPTFDSIRINNQILNTYDFVVNETSVNEDDAHGMNCLSTISANLPGLFIGTAPKAIFCLYRTEDVASETKIEEHNLAAGFERSDSIGVDVVSVSLGYNQFDIPSQNYTYADLNGNITLSAIAADLAAKKGMLPVVAAGNEGTSAWHYIITPADADSVMTVGAVDTLGNIASFSSFGPSSDGQIKPDLAATGRNAIVASPSTGLPVYSNGTSFATPNLAGLTTCLWQAFPEFNNMSILDAMRRSASKFTTPDNRVGYGIPDMKKAFVILLKKSYTQQVAVAGCTASFQVNVKEDNTMNVVIERKISSGSPYTIAQTIAGTGNFTNKILNFTDALAPYPSGSVTYRIRLDIAADTSFYLDSLTVNYTPKAALGADKNISVCNSSTFNLTAQYNTAGLSTVWTMGGTAVANAAAVSVSGVYQLIASGVSGCADTALINLNFGALYLGPDKTVVACTNSTYDLTQLFNTQGLVSTWTIGGVTVSNPVAVSSPGIYRLTVSNPYGCFDTAIVNLSIVAKLNIGADTTVKVCRDTPYDITTLYNTVGLTPSWTKGGSPVTAPSAVTVSGIYQLIVSNNTGCSDTALVTLNIAPAFNLGADKIIPKCPSSLIDLTSVFNLTGLTVNWSFLGVNIAAPTTVLNAGIYKVNVSNNFGCVDTALVTLLNDLALCVVNSISVTPNPVSDHANVVISRTVTSKIEILVINSSGRKVYETAYQQAAGTQIESINMQGMAGGIYFITVFADDKKMVTRKIFKK